MKRTSSTPRPLDNLLAAFGAVAPRNRSEARAELTAVGIDEAHLKGRLSALALLFPFPALHETRDREREIDILNGAFDAASPRNRPEAEDELRSLGIDPTELATGFGQRMRHRFRLRQLTESVPHAVDKHSTRQRALLNSLLGTNEDVTRLVALLLESRVSQRHEPQRHAIVELWNEWRQELSLARRTHLISSARDRLVAELVKTGERINQSDETLFARCLQHCMELLDREARNGSCAAVTHQTSGTIAPRTVTPQRPASHLAVHRRYEFMRRHVRRGRAFRVEYIGDRLRLSLKEVRYKQKHGIFSDHEIAALLNLPVRTMQSLMTPDASLTALNALAEQTGYLDPTMAEVIQISGLTGLRGAASNGPVGDAILRTSGLDDYWTQLRRKFDDAHRGKGRTRRGE